MNSLYLNKIFEEQCVKYNKLNTTLNSPFDDLTYQVPLVCKSKSHLVESKILLKVVLESKILLKVVLESKILLKVVNTTTSETFKRYLSHEHSGYWLFNYFMLET